MTIADQTDSATNEVTSSSQSTSINSEATPGSEESNVIEFGSKSEVHHKELLVLLRRLRIWYENVDVDGLEDVRKELRRAHFYMTRINNVSDFGLLLCIYNAVIELNCYICHNSIFHLISIA